MWPEQAYSPHRCCPKCGHHIVHSKHTVLAFGLGEVIRRTCDRCQAVWDERCRDAPTKASA